MKIRFLNNTLENRRFDYTPRYYDERKEALKRKQDRYEKIESGDLSHEERREMFRDKLKNEMTRGEYRQGQYRSANIRVILLILVLCALGYFIFNGVDEIDTVVNNLW